jgi:DNA-binding LytR/AlgR family response regulator
MSDRQLKGKPLKIAICEDFDNDAEQLVSLISESGTLATVTRFNNGEEFLSSFSTEESGFDLIFLDVYMDDLTGIETARLLRERGDTCRIVFTTSSPDFSLDAFDVDAEQYLLKPVELDKKLEKILTKHLKQAVESPLCPLNVKGTIIEVPLEDILYAEVLNHNCLIHTTSEIYETGGFMTLRSLSQLLCPPRFVQSSRSYIVNLGHVKSIDRDFLMQNGDTVYISRGGVPEMKKAYMSWLLNEAIQESE